MGKKKPNVLGELASLREDLEALKLWKKEHEANGHGISFSEKERTDILENSKKVSEPSLVRGAHNKILP